MTDDPISAEQAAMQKAWAEWSAAAEDCPHCEVRAVPRPIGQGRTVVEVEHEAGCPNGED